MPITFNSSGGFLAGTISSSGNDIFITTSGSVGKITLGNTEYTASQVIEKDSAGNVRNKKTFNADGTITQEKFDASGVKATTKIRNPLTGVEVRRSGSATSNQIEFSQNNAGALIVVSGSNPGFTAFMNDVGDRGIRARGDVFTSGSSNPQICSTGVAMDGSPLDYYIQMNHIGALGLTHTFGDSNGTGFLMVSQSGDTRVSKNLIVDGGITATSLNVTHFTSSFITASTIETSGSSIFGDDSTDTHLFRGHITASGNISASGNIIAHSGSFNYITASIVDVDGDTIRFGGEPFTKANIQTLKLGRSLKPPRAGRSKPDIDGDDGVFDGNITASGNIKAGGNLELTASSAGDLLKTKFVQMTNSSSVIDTFNTASFRSVKYVLQVTSASNYQVSEMLVLHHNSTASNTEYAQINSGLNLINFSTDVNNSNVRLNANGSFISCSVRYDRTIIPI